MERITKSQASSSEQKRPASGAHSAALDHQRATVLAATVSMALVLTLGQLGQCARPSASSTLAPHDQSESLKMNLNESLTRFIQAAAATHQRQPQQQQQQQQQQVSAINNNSANQKLQHSTTTTTTTTTAMLKKISCDELNLVVLAQRALNVSFSSGAISRLIECKQENLLDLNRFEMVASQRERSAGAERANLTSAELAPEQPRRLDLPVARESEFVQLVDNVADQFRSHEIHFGAKVAISILSATILLVLTATLVDYQMESASKLSPNDKDNLLFGGKKDSRGLRNYRSLSMSSNCSSNLFCSTNSVASSSAPFLSNSAPTTVCSSKSTTTTTTTNNNNNNNNCNFKSGDHSAAASLSSCSPQPPILGQTGDSHYHYELNLQMLHLCPNQFEGTGASFKPLTINMPTPSQNPFIQTTGPPEGRATKSPLYLSPIYTDYTHVLERPHSEAPGSTSSVEQADHFYRTAKNILLAFSLRQSAKQIFDTTQQQARPSGSHSTSATTNAALSGSCAQRESVDSLHGLRFLSMIWVIVIHSYNFALRWMFFSNTTTLDGIYKSAASQLIANGSFACDSFFFAGGFLLPYLAFGGAASGAESETSSATASGDTRQQASPEASSNSASALKEGQSCACHLVASLIDARRRQPAARACDLMGSRSACDACAPAAGAKPQVAILVSRGPAASAEGGTANQGQRKGCYLHTNELANDDNNNSSSSNAGRPRPPSRVVRDKFTVRQIVGNILHRYVRMMPLMMAIIGLCSTLLRYLGEGPVWKDSTMMYDGWCRKNWWINAIFLHNFVNRENMCLSHSWYSAVDLQLFLLGQLILFVLAKSRRWGLTLLVGSIVGSQLITMWLTVVHHLPAVPLVSSVNEQTMNLYYGEIYIKPYCRASPYLIGILLAYLMRTTSLGQLRLQKWQILSGWSLALGSFVAIILAMQPAMNGHALSELESALYSALSRPLWALATGWMIFACITDQGGPIAKVLGARCFVPLSRLTYPAFLIHPIVMALFYGSRQASFHFSHYLMLYLILGNIVITYACAFVLAALVELPLLSIERALSRRASSKL